MLSTMATKFRSGDALLVFDADRTVVGWNEAAEKLTGIPASEALGKRCWEVLGGTDVNGSLVCHPGCSGARLAAEGWPVGCQVLLMKTRDGMRKELTVSTISVRDGSEPLFIHLLRNGEEIAAGEERAKPSGREPRLTDRQLEVLALMAEGLSARSISERLGIAEPTVRNHIRSILLELGCHSQLEALAKARRWQFI